MDMMKSIDIMKLNMYHASDGRNLCNQTSFEFNAVDKLPVMLIQVFTRVKSE